MRKHFAIIKGEVREQRWNIKDSWNYGFLFNSRDNSYIENEFFKRKYIATNTKNKKFEAYVVNYEIKTDMKEIWSGEILRPILEVGEEIWINELNLLVKVTKRYRTTNNEIIYETSHLAESKTTEETEKSRLRVVDLWFRLLYPEFKTFDELKKEFIVEEAIDFLIEEEDNTFSYHTDVEMVGNKELEIKSFLDWVNPFKLVRRIKDEMNNDK